MFTFVANPPNLANRGVHSYVNVAGSRLAGTVPDLPFATVAGYEAYRAADSVREYLQLGGRRADLQYDVDHGYVAYTSTRGD